MDPAQTFETDIRRAGNGSGVERQSPSLSIVIPAFNEEQNIPEVLSRLSSTRDHLIASGTVSDVEIIVVDDFSADDTRDKVREFGSGVKLVQHTENKGYGAALQTGFAAANGEWIGFLDADLTYPPECLRAICQTMADEDADIVLGSRMMKHRGGMPVQRYIGNKLFAYLLSWIMDDRITDTASGMRVFKRRILSRLSPLPEGLHLTPAMSTQALLEDLKVVEISIPYHERGGRSKLNAITDGIRFLKIILGTARLYRPMKFFGAAGAAFLVLACVLGLSPLLHYISLQRVEDYTIYRLFTVMVALVVGTNLLTFGAFSEKVLQIVYDRPNYGGFWSRWLFPKAVLDRFGTIGAAAVASGILLNYKAILQYVTTLQVTIHWSYVLTGATLVLCGFQMVMASFLVEVIRIVKAQKSDSPSR